MDMNLPAGCAATGGEEVERREPQKRLLVRIGDHQDRRLQSAHAVMTYDDGHFPGR